MRRQWWIALAALVVVAIIGLRWLDRDAEPAVPPPAGAAALAALGDRDLSRQVMTDLGNRVLGRAGDPTAWRRFNQPARHVWSLGMLDQWLAAYGLARLRELLSQQADAPGFADAATACAAMGLPDVAAAFNQAVEAEGQAVMPAQSRLATALAAPATAAARVAYLRAHVTELAAP